MDKSSEESDYKSALTGGHHFCDETSLMVNKLKLLDYLRKLLVIPISLQKYDELEEFIRGDTHT